jgi:hypothetical protein
MVRATHSKQEPKHLLDGRGRPFALLSRRLSLFTTTGLTGSAGVCCCGVGFALGGEETGAGGIRGFLVGLGLKGMRLPSFGKFLPVTSSVMNIRQGVKPQVF